MKRIYLATTVLVVASALAVAGKNKPEDSVTYAKSWAAAVAEAKMLNLPIVVHCHGFGWPPCNSVHGSVLTNKKYIKFAEENTVEVIAMGKIALGQQRSDKRLQTYKHKDGNEYLVGWPNLTLGELEKNAAESSKWNNTRGIPYTCIVNPHTNERMGEHISGGYGAGKLMDLVKVAKKTLEKEYGKSVSRKKLRKYQKAETKARGMLDKGEITKAMSEARKLERSVAKQPKAVQEIATTLIGDIVKAAGKELDEAEALIGRGALKEAQKALSPLVRALKGTDAEKRALDLMARTKVEKE